MCVKSYRFCVSLTIHVPYYHFQHISTFYFSTSVPDTMKGIKGEFTPVNVACISIFVALRLRLLSDLYQQRDISFIFNPSTLLVTSHIVGVKDDRSESFLQTNENPIRVVLGEY